MDAPAPVVKKCPHALIFSAGMSGRFRIPDTPARHIAVIAIHAVGDHPPEEMAIAVGGRLESRQTAGASRYEAFESDSVCARIAGPRWTLEIPQAIGAVLLLCGAVAGAAAIVSAYQARRPGARLAFWIALPVVAGLAAISILAAPPAPIRIIGIQPPAGSPKPWTPSSRGLELIFPGPRNSRILRLIAAACAVVKSCPAPDTISAVTCGATR